MADYTSELPGELVYVLFAKHGTQSIEVRTSPSDVEGHDVYLRNASDTYRVHLARGLLDDLAARGGIPGELEVKMATIDPLMPTLLKKAEISLFDFSCALRGAQSAEVASFGKFKTENNL